MGILLSCTSKKHGSRQIVASVILEDGRVKKQSVQEIQVIENQYVSLIETFTRGFLLLKSYIGLTPTDSVVIECNNTAFVKWVNSGVCLHQYDTEFNKMMDVLDGIPIKWECLYSGDVKAKPLCVPSRVQRDVLCSVDDFFK